MPVEWPKLALDWLFAQLLKWNRSACPRVCVISMSFAYVNRARLSLRGCTERGSRFVSRGRRRSKWVSRSPLIPPSQTRCLGRSNTGRSAGCTVSTLTHAARPAHQLLSARQSCWIYRWATGEFNQPRHPGKVRTLFIFTSLTIPRNITDYVCLWRWGGFYGVFFLNHPQEFDADIMMMANKQTVLRVEGLIASNITEKGVTVTIIPVRASGFI